MRNNIFSIKFTRFTLLVAAGMLSPAAQACSLNFTHPGHGKKVTTQGIVVRGTGAGDAQEGDYGTVTALHNGIPIFQQTGTFTAIVSFLRSAGVGVQLVPGRNHFYVSGSVGGCSASDTMTVYYDNGSDTTLNDLNPEKNNGGGSHGNGPANCAGNPINFAMGHKVQMEQDWQATAPTTFPLRFERVFNSADGYWRHNYSTRLKVEPTTITLIFSDGRRQPFGRNGSTITAEPDEQGSLVASTEGSSAWIYTDHDNVRYEFNVDGRLMRHVHPHGFFHSLIYLDDGTITVTDGFGNSLNFAEDAQFQPKHLVASGTDIAYSYDSLRRLVSATKITGGVTGLRAYHYENTNYPLFLTGITDERGVRFATYVYDSLGRAIESRHAGGADKVIVTYHADGSSTVTNALGRQTTYHYGVVHGVKRIVQIQGEPTPNCPASNSSFTYNSQGLLASQTNKKGYQTLYEYNTRGLETIRTEAVGTAQQRITTTQWHPTLPLPLRREQAGRIQMWTYDSQGRALSTAVVAE